MGGTIVHTYASNTLYPFKEGSGFYDKDLRMFRIRCDDGTVVSFPREAVDFFITVPESDDVDAIVQGYRANMLPTPRTQAYEFPTQSIG